MSRSQYEVERDAHVTRVQKFNRSIDTYKHSIDTLYSRLKNYTSPRQAGKLRNALASETTGLREKQEQLQMLSRRINWLESELDQSAKGQEIARVKEQLQGTSAPILKAKLSGELMALKLLPPAHFESRPYQGPAQPAHQPQSTSDEEEEEFHYPAPEPVCMQPPPVPIMQQYPVQMQMPVHHQYFPPPAPCPVPPPFYHHPMMYPPPPCPPSFEQHYFVPPPAFQQPVSKAIRSRRPVDPSTYSCYSGGFAYPVGFGPDGSYYGGSQASD